MTDPFCTVTSAIAIVVSLAALLTMLRTKRLHRELDNARSRYIAAADQYHTALDKFNRNMEERFRL